MSDNKARDAFVSVITDYMNRNIAYLKGIESRRDTTQSLINNYRDICTAYLAANDEKGKGNDEYRRYIDVRNEMVNEEMSLEKMGVSVTLLQSIRTDVYKSAEAAKQSGLSSCDGIDQSRIVSDELSEPDFFNGSGFEAEGPDLT